MKVMYKLFQSSWRDDAVQLDREKGIYTAPELVRKINHQGKFFNVPGPHIVQPSPQRTPLLLQAGASKAGKIFAAQHAEVGALPAGVTIHPNMMNPKNLAGGIHN